MTTDLSKLDDLALHDIVYEIVDENRQASQLEIEQLASEAVTRTDLVLVAAAVELCNMLPTYTALRLLRHVISRGLKEHDLDILLLDELSTRLPHACFADFMPYLDGERDIDVQRFCSKVLLFDFVLCDHEAIKQLFLKHTDPVVKVYLAAILFRTHPDKDYIAYIGKQKKSDNLVVAREAKNVICELGL